MARENPDNLAIWRSAEVGRNGTVARTAAGAARLGPRLAARGVRVEIDAGFVDLAAQFAALVRRQATAAAALLLLLGGLAPLIVAARVLLLELARVDALLRHAFATLLVALDRLRLLILGLATAVAVMFLAERRRAGTSDSNANHKRADERQPAAMPSTC
ncbi:MAG: hypothetical protein ABWY27_12915 [Telluria sp.]